MADQPLGELDVVVSADWSELQDAFSQIETAGQAAAGAVAAAFSDTSTFSAMVEALETVSEGLDSVAAAAQSTLDALSDISDAGETASSGFSSLGDAVSSANDALGDVGDTASTAGDALGDVASSADDASGSLSDLSAAATDVDTEAADASSSVEDLGEAAAAAGSDAEDATEGITQFSEAASNAGTAAEEGGSGISVFRGSLLELAEGLAVTDGLKDFAEESLEVYSNVQQATISLTALTGSAADANEEIDTLEQTALKIPVATQSLIGAAQRMVAFGLTTQQANEMLGDAANAAFAAGNAFDSVAQRIGNMAAVGQAGARQLLTLGLTSQELADTMNTLGVSSNATADNVTKLFKALDQSQRVDVLDTALTNFAGIGASSAQTVGGAWQILENQWEQIMKQIGGVLAPVALAVISFASTVGTAVTAAIDWFKELPPVIQDVGIAAAVAVGAIGPLLTALASISLAVIGIQSIPEVFDRLVKSISGTGGAATIATPQVAGLTGAIEAQGAAATTTAPQLTTLATAETLAGTAAVEGGAAIAKGGEAAAAAAESTGALATALGTAGTAVGVVAGTWAGWKLMEWATGDALAGEGALSEISSGAKAVATEVVNAGKAFVTWASTLPTAAFNTATTAINNTEGALEKLLNLLPGGAEAAKQVGAAFQQITDAGNPLTTVLGQIQQGFDNLNRSGLNAVTAVQINTSATEQYQDALQNATYTQADTVIATNNVSAQYAKLTGALATAKAALAQVQAAYTAGTASAGELAIANQDVTKAQNALNSAMGDASTKANAAAKSLDHYASSTQAMQDVMESFAQEVQDASDKILNAQAKQGAEADVLAGVWLSLATDANASADSQSAAWDKAKAAATSAGEAIGTAISNAAGQMGGFDTQIAAAQAALSQLAVSGTASADDLNNAISNLATVGSTAGKSIDQIVNAVNEALAVVPGLGVVIENGKLQLVGFSAAADGTTSSITQLRGAAVPATQAVQNFGTAVANTKLPLADAKAAAQGMGTAAGNATTNVGGLATAFGNAGGGLTYATSKAGQAMSAMAGATPALVGSIDGTSVAAGTATTSIDQYGKALTTTVAPSGSLTTAVNAGAQAVINAQQGLPAYTAEIDQYGKVTTTTEGAVGSLTDATIPLTTATQQVTTAAQNSDGTWTTVTTTIQGLSAQTDDATTSTNDLGGALNDATTDTGNYVTGANYATKADGTLTYSNEELAQSYYAVATAAEAAAQATGGGSSGGGSGGDLYGGDDSFTSGDMGAVDLKTGMYTGEAESTLTGQTGVSGLGFSTKIDVGGSPPPAPAASHHERWGRRGPRVLRPAQPRVLLPAQPERQHFRNSLHSSPNSKAPHPHLARVLPNSFRH